MKKNIVIVLLTICVLGLGVFLVYDKMLKKEQIDTNSNENNSTNQSLQLDNKTNEFLYKNYTLNLLSKIDNINNIYAVDIRFNSDYKYDIYIRYINEEEVKIATIVANDDSDLEYRTLDVDNNKLYYIIKSREIGNIFELYYIDLNNLVNGAIKLDDFNTRFIEDNITEINGTNYVYSTQIYVKNDDIYYSSLKEESLKKYNIKSKETETILDNITWCEYFIDKINSKIFYINSNDQNLYLADLDGTNSIELDNSLYTGSGFWTHAYYNELPLFRDTVMLDSDQNEIVDLYVYDYDINTFTKIKENVNNYDIKHNMIEKSSTDGIKYSFFLK